MELMATIGILLLFAMIGIIAWIVIYYGTQIIIGIFKNLKRSRTKNNDQDYYVY